MRINFKKNIRTIIKDALSWTQEVVKDLEKIEKDHINQATAVVDVKMLLGRHKYDKRRRVFRVYRRLIDKLLIRMKFLLPRLDKLNRDVSKLHDMFYKISKIIKADKEAILIDSRESRTSESDIIGWTQAKVDDIELLSETDDLFETLVAPRNQDWKSFETTFSACATIAICSRNVWRDWERWDSREYQLTSQQLDDHESGDALPEERRWLDSPRFGSDIACTFLGWLDGIRGLRHLEGFGKSADRSTETAGPTILVSFVGSSRVTERFSHMFDVNM